MSRNCSLVKAGGKRRMTIFLGRFSAAVVAVFSLSLDDDVDCFMFFFSLFKFNLNGILNLLIYFWLWI